MLTWDFGAIFVVYRPLVAALLPQYWHEARLDKRQEQSILRWYPVPDRGAVVWQGRAPKRTCTVPPDAWYCRAAQCVGVSLGGRSMALLPDASLPCLLSPLEALSAPYLRCHGYRPSPCFRHTAGTLPGLLKRATGAPVRRVSAETSPAYVTGVQQEPQGEARRSPRKCTSQERRPTTAVARRALQTHAERIAVKGMCRNVAGCALAWIRADTAGSSGPARKMFYPVEAQFQQPDGAWSVCARPRSGARDSLRSASCAPAATTPAETSTWVGPLGPADGITGPRGAEGYPHLYGGPVRRSVSGVYWEELCPAQWACARVVPGGAELRGAGHGSASHGLQYGIGPPHFHPTTAHVPHGRRLPVEAKNSSSVWIYHGSTKIRDQLVLSSGSLSSATNVSIELGGLMQNRNSNSQPNRPLKGPRGTLTISLDLYTVDFAAYMC
ncbi:hypothetical protein B0H14DRAFT_2574575 [Mycena olivaceomarginata]|nr:hypothetical protein B0H14DRAFT_2574575 [Mycena olivaceomarginata]